MEKGGLPMSRHMMRESPSAESAWLRGKLFGKPPIFFRINDNGTDESLGPGAEVIGTCCKRARK